MCADVGEKPIKMLQNVLKRSFKMRFQASFFFIENLFYVLSMLNYSGHIRCFLLIFFRCIQDLVKSIRFVDKQ